ncbi:MAG: hypothetical protein Q8R78_00305 [Candidatus Omnitrophota bacterium]|nr:hypothetical protein [Candidatus Omnitrophota bacterium]
MDPRLSQGLAVLTTAAITVASWIWAYQPTVRGYRANQQQMEMLSSRVAAVDAMVQAAGGVDPWRTQHLPELARLKSRFASQDQIPHALNTLVETIKVDEVKLLNVSQGNVEAVHDGGQPVLVDGQPCARLPVTVTAEGRYHTLVQVMQRIMTEAFPSLVSIEQAEFRLKEPVGAQLALTLRLYLYVVGTPTEPAPDA